MTKIVYYLSPSSFCFGVKRSIDELNKITQKHLWEKIFCIHSLVHNPKVTKEFQNKWIKFVENINEVKDLDSIIIFSAHWTNRVIIDYAIKNFKAVYNLECPFVTKIYREIDYSIEQWINTFFYIGKPLHQEGKNVLDYASYKWANIYVFQTKEDIPNIDKQKTFSVLSQTTLNFQYVEKIFDQIKDIYPNAKFNSVSDICKATYERQTVVLQNLNKFDSFIVIWWKDSNNTKELYNIWIENWKKTFYWESLNEILLYWKDNLLFDKRIAITWWASTPVWDINEVFDFYKNNWYKPQIIKLKD
jgi:(E)-4-hydroxy-3-methyl-but-2-enyl pyrophosphate reductase